jgi:hypothetical protein
MVEISKASKSVLANLVLTTNKRNRRLRLISIAQCSTSNKLVFEMANASNPNANIVVLRAILDVQVEVSTWMRINKRKLREATNKITTRYFKKSKTCCKVFHYHQHEVGCS